MSPNSSSSPVDLLRIAAWERENPRQLGKSLSLLIDWLKAVYAYYRQETDSQHYCLDQLTQKVISVEHSDHLRVILPELPTAIVTRQLDEVSST